jgi:putative ABC transport system ATP-binding protein
MSLIEARDVYKSFGQTPALRGASVAAGQGEILAIMGPSGSGKSTLLHCLAGIFAPDSGEVWFDESRLDTLDEAARTKLRRTAFGFVFQFGQLVPELTAADNVALPLLLNRVKRRAAYTTAQTWLDKLGLGDKGGRRTGELSGGEAQRVAVARALALAPKLIFADEPTGSLDSLTGEKVMDLLVTLVREQGTTAVIVTHDARVAAYADRMVMVRDGLVSFDPGTAPTQVPTQAQTQAQAQAQAPRHARADSPSAAKAAN